MTKVQFHMWGPCTVETPRKMKMSVSLTLLHIFRKYLMVVYDLWEMLASTYGLIITPHAINLVLGRERNKRNMMNIEQQLPFLQLVQSLVFCRHLTLLTSAHFTFFNYAFFLLCSGTDTDSEHKLMSLTTWSLRDGRLQRRGKPCNCRGRRTAARWHACVTYNGKWRHPGYHRWLPPKCLPVKPRKSRRRRGGRQLQSQRCCVKTPQTGDTEPAEREKKTFSFIIDKLVHYSPKSPLCSFCHL